MYQHQVLSLDCLKYEGDLQCNYCFCCYSKQLDSQHESGLEYIKCEQALTGLLSIAGETLFQLIEIYVINYRSL